MSLKTNINLLVALVCLLSCSNLRGQNNYIMTDPGLKWNTISIADIGSIYMHYEYDKDTMIMNTEYSKIDGSSNYLIRNDSGKVYITWLDGGVYGSDWDDEYLRYDFNLSAGDTFITNYPTSIFDRPDTMIVTSVQYVMMANDELRRVWTLTLPNFQSYEPFYWYEGIGSNYGFDYLNHFNTSVGVHLTCFFDSSELIYDGGFYPFDTTCGTSISSIEQFSVEKQVNIYPNPVSDKLRVNFDLDKPQLIRIRLFDLLGELIFEMPLISTKDEEYEIDIPARLNGVYLLVINLPTELISRKVVLIK